MKNGTTINLPATDEALAHLGVNLATSFSEKVLQYFVSNGWAAKI